MNGRRQQVLPPGLQAGLPSAAADGLRRLVRPLLALLLILTLTGLAVPVAPAAAVPLPWRPRPMERQPVAPTGVPAPLQEVSPPEAVQQLQSALGSRQPVVEIVSPRADSVLPAGPWTLRLRVHDWPLVDGGPLGMGPHLVVQLDQEPPRIWTSSEGVMPELSPGSHRLTVYAALPWGEARKNPGAAAQIRLHRSAANPLTQPAAGTPQLLAVSPSGAAAEEPLLLDWLLLEAPLQDVGGSGTQWRLRVTINGDAFLLDQQSALWLRGWRAGANALQLELLDGRGEPLNPPFNSLVQEVDLDRAATRPRWRGGPLSAAELAILLGEAPTAAARQPGPPLQAEASTAAAATASGGHGVSATAPGSNAAAAPAGSASPSGERAGVDVTTLAAGAAADQRPAVLPASPAGAEPTTSAPAPPQATGPERAPASSAAANPQASTSTAETPTDAEVPPASSATPRPPRSAGAAEDTDRDGGPDPEGVTGRADSTESRTDRPPAAPATSATPTPASATSETMATERPGLAAASRSASAVPEPPRQAPAASGSSSMMPAGAAKPSEPTDAAGPHPTDMSMTTASAPSADLPEAAQPAPLQSDPEDPAQLQTSEAERVRPTTSLSGRARDLVNDDGTLRRPERRGPLAGLRERLQR